MPIAIRRAVPQDAQAIVDLIAAAFHEEANAAHIQALIEEGEHLTFVAEDEKVVGFIDGFYTIGKWDLRRLELDLLAVHPEYSGKGIGKALIRKFTESQENASSIRVLVATDNTAMQHAMQATGYKQHWNTASLYIADTGTASIQMSDEGLIPVKTLTYTGIWMEGTVSKESIEAAHYLRQALAYDLVGKVLDDVFDKAKTLENLSDIEDTVPILDTYIDSLASEKQILIDEGFKFVKQFHWWHYEILSKEQLISYLKHWAEEHGG